MVLLWYGKLKIVILSSNMRQEIKDKNLKVALSSSLADNQEEELRILVKLSEYFLDPAPRHCLNFY